VVHVQGHDHVSARRNADDGFWGSDVYLGHVREYPVPELVSLAEYLGLADVKVLGKNWFSALYGTVRIRAIAEPVDKMLQHFPDLCGSLFLSARKAAQKSTSA